MPWPYWTVAVGATAEADVIPCPSPGRQTPIDSVEKASPVQARKRKFAETCHERRHQSMARRRGMSGAVVQSLFISREPRERGEERRGEERRGEERRGEERRGEERRGEERRGEERRGEPSHLVTVPVVCLLPAIPLIGATACYSPHGGDRERLHALLRKLQALCPKASSQSVLLNHSTSLPPAPHEFKAMSIIAKVVRGKKLRG